MSAVTPAAYADPNLRGRYIETAALAASYTKSVPRYHVTLDLPFVDRHEVDLAMASGDLVVRVHEVLGGRHVYPDAVDRYFDEVFHPRFHYTFRTFKVPRFGSAEAPVGLRTW